MKFFARLKRIYWCFTGFLLFLWVCIVASIVSLAVGCASLPDEERAEIYGYATNAVERAIAAIDARKEKADEAPPQTSSDAGAQKPAADTTANGGQSASAPASGTLVFKYGGFDGSKAAEDPNTQIKDLHMSKSGMSYKWAKGSLRNWGITPDTNTGALACAFYWDGKQWVGGKFDHISTSRTTRDFKNLEDYKGWSKGPFFAAKKRAFCIMSEDGKRRTNLLETTEP